MVIISLSLSRKLLNDFDEVLKEKGDKNRSKGIRNALEDHIMRYRAKEIKKHRVEALATYHKYHYN